MIAQQRRDRDNLRRQRDQEEKEAREVNAPFLHRLHYLLIHSIESASRTDKNPTRASGGAPSRKRARRRGKVDT